MMVVRVKTRLLRDNDKMRDLVVLVNSGAESDEPTIVIDKDNANALGFKLEDFDVIEVELASGKTHSYISRDKVKVELLDEEGKVLSSTHAYVAVDEMLNEPLITDSTIDELGIQVISFKKGLWRHINDPPNVVRESAR
ncbi:MAG: hypothetical protein ACXQTB_03925 [Candidatus Nezhaarchaeales archaeon]